MTKTSNFSNDDMKALSIYDSKGTQAERDAAVKSIADTTGKTTRSIIAKLSNMEVYVAKERVTKTGEKVVSKADLVASIEKGLNTKSLDSLMKATKADLNKLVGALNVSRETLTNG